MAACSDGINQVEENLRDNGIGRFGVVRMKAILRCLSEMIVKTLRLLEFLSFH